MFHGKSVAAGRPVATVPAVVVRTTSRTVRKYWPALTWPPPGCCTALVVNDCTAATFFSAYRFDANWNGLPPPPAAGAPPIPAPAAAAPAMVSYPSVRGLSIGCSWPGPDAANAHWAMPSGDTEEPARGCRE